jgi:serine/threonine-protein phosphatase 2A regulatory subunit B'
VDVCVNVQVAERALFLWNNDHFVSLVAQNRQVVLPLIFAALERNTRSHWNQAVHGLTLNVRKMFLEMDQEVFQECQRKFQEDEAKAKGLEEKREDTWKRLEAAGTLLTGNSNIKVSNVPSDRMVNAQTGS